MDKALTGDVLEIRYVALHSAAMWDRNPKKHDIPAMIDAVEKHGFRDAPIFDGALNGIVAGNGRVATLKSMQEMGKECPPGVATDDDGVWYVPIQFGIDARSRAAAESFGVSHNNLTMAGGDFSFLDISGLWEREEYLELLRSLGEAGEMPDGITDADMDLLESLLDDVPTLDELEAEYGPVTDDDGRIIIKIAVDPDVADAYDKLMEAAPGGEDYAKFAAIVYAVDYSALVAG